MWRNHHSLYFGRGVPLSWPPHVADRRWADGVRLHGVDGAGPPPLGVPPPARGEKRRGEVGLELLRLCAEPVPRISVSSLLGRGMRRALMP